MKILNKFIWSKKEPSNKNDIWFDGSTWRMYTEEAWQSFTLPVDAADKVAKVLENASEVYQEKLNAGYGIIIEGNTISLDDSIKYDDSDVWEAIETLQQNKVEQTQLNDYVTLDRYESTAQMLIDNINELDSIKVNKNAVATINGQSLIAGGNIVIPTGGESYDDTEIKQQLTELSEEIESNGQLIEDLQNMKIDKENDDYYPKMAVGLADNLSGVDVVDSEVNFRRSGGGAITDGVARIEAIKGNSVVWNQLLEPTHKGNGRLNVYKENGKWVAEVTELGNNSEGASLTIPVIKGQTSVQGHKYLATLDITNDYSLEPAVKIGNAYKTGTFHIIESSNSSLMYLYPFGAGSSQKFAQGSKAVLNVALFCDLTKMFGAGNEPTTIEEFYARTPMGVDLNAYNEGEVIHMDVQSIESVGVNQWDEEWEPGRIDVSTGNDQEIYDSWRSKNFTKVMPNAEYYIKGGALVRIVYYDKDFKFVDWWGCDPYKVTTMPSNVCYVRLTQQNLTAYAGGISINLSDASVNGKYYPYIKRQEDLSLIRKYFPQGMKSAGTAHDEIRYNKASGKWEKVVRIGEVDMGALTYHRAEIKNTNETYYVIYTYGLKDIVKLPSYRDIGNVLTQGYLAKPTLSLFDYILAEKTIMLYGDGTLYIRDDAYTNVASFKAAMAGVMLYYELAEPIITELDKEDQLKDLDYQVWNCGTEKAIAEGKSAPLAADITYGFNAIGKIKELENLVAALRAKVGI